MMMQAKLEGCCKKISDVEIFDEFIGAITLPSYCFDCVRPRVKRGRLQKTEKE